MMMCGEKLFWFVGSVKRRAICAMEFVEESDVRERGLLRRGSYRMHTSAVEKPTRMNSIGTRNASFWTRLRFSPLASLEERVLGGMQIAAIMLTNRQTAKRTTRVRRVLAMSLCLRKYFRRVISAARWEEEDRAQMYRMRTKWAP